MSASISLQALVHDFLDRHGLKETSNKFRKDVKIKRSDLQAALDSTPGAVTIEQMYEAATTTEQQDTTTAAAGEDLHHLVHDFLHRHGLEETSKKFQKETGIVRVTTPTSIDGDATCTIEEMYDQVTRGKNQLKNDTMNHILIQHQ